MQPNCSEIHGKYTNKKKNKHKRAGGHKAKAYLKNKKILKFKIWQQSQNSTTTPKKNHFEGQWITSL
jgi:hypothetical protein